MQQRRTKNILWMNESNKEDNKQNNEHQTYTQ